LLRSEVVCMKEPTPGRPAWFNLIYRRWSGDSTREIYSLRKWRAASFVSKDIKGIGIPDTMATAHGEGSDALEESVYCTCNAPGEHASWLSQWVVCSLPVFVISCISVYVSFCLSFLYVRFSVISSVVLCVSVCLFLSFVYLFICSKSWIRQRSLVRWLICGIMGLDSDEEMEREEKNLTAG